MTHATRQWVKKAEDDYRTAISLEGEKKWFHDQVCFHCQQSAEKYMKAILDERGQTVPRVHDCDYLRRCLVNAGIVLPLSRRGLVFLTRFAVASRYPGDSANARQARAALRWARDVRRICRDELGLSTKLD